MGFFKFITGLIFLILIGLAIFWTILSLGIISVDLNYPPDKYVTYNCECPETHKCTMEGSISTCIKKEAENG